jgi:serine/threonine protein kinase
VLKQDGPCEPKVALNILRQVSRAMAHAHIRGVVHRDLKPDNLMLLTSNDAVFVKILDFGIAQNVGPPGTRLTPTGAALGTSHYMSPEQARGESQVGPATDVYSLGVILYELLSDPPREMTEAEGNALRLLRMSEVSWANAIGCSDLARALERVKLPTRTVADVTAELKTVIGDSTRGAEVHRLTLELLRMLEVAK